MRERKILCTNDLTKFLVDLDGIWFAIETCWSGAFYTHSILSDQYSKENTVFK